MFYNLFGCMHACILHVLSVCLTRECTEFEASLRSILKAVCIGKLACRAGGKKFAAVVAPAKVL